MTHTTLRHEGALRFQIVRPLTPDIVRISLSSELQDRVHTTPATHIALTGNLALSGTAKKHKDVIAAYLKQNGIMLSVSTSGHTITYDVAVMRTNCKKAVAILDELIFHTRIPKTEFITERTRTREHIREEKDNAKYVANILFSTLLFPKNSTHRISSLDEQKKQLEAMTHASIQQIVNDIPKGKITVTCVGDAEVVDMLMPLIRKLGKTARETTHAAETYTPQASKAAYTTIKSQTNIEVRIGNHLPFTQRDALSIPFMFGLTVLGKVGGFSGRLMSTVREKEGLTYGIYAQTVEDAHDTGYWYVYTFFMAKDLEKGIASTLREIRNIAETGITNEELHTFKEILENQFLLSHESNARMQRLYHNALLHEQTETDLAALRARTASLTAEEVNSALRAHLHPDHILIAGAGPVTKDGKGIIS